MKSAENKLINPLKNFILAITDTYGCIVFSQSSFYGLIILISTFLSPLMGIAGLLGTITALFFARLLQFDVWDNPMGYYGFNSMLTSLAVAYYYPVQMISSYPHFFILSICFASLISLFLFVFIQNLWLKYFSVNSLSLSFSSTAIIIWMFFFKYGFYENHATTLNFIFNPVIRLPLFWQYYFQSLGSIFFMPVTIAGILIAIIILLQSRLNFILTLIGFSICYIFVDLWISDVHQGILFYGFNSILIALVLGGVYILPDLIAWLFIAFSVILGLLTGMVFQHFFGAFSVPVFTVPFCLTTLIILYTLRLRLRNKYPYIIDFNLTIPEKSLDYYHSRISRFGLVGIPQFFMPVIGEWTITQGHHGAFTHRYNQAYAYDFEITDQEGKNFRGEESDLFSYYSYGKPVFASASGYVAKVISGIEDNPVSQINPENNWGNYVTIYHSENLYSLYAHLKNNSILVKEGDYIYAGDKIAQLGNSGRSAVPHLHFQIQTAHLPGGKTLYANLVNFKKTLADKLYFISYGNPHTNDKVMSFSPTKEVQSLLHFLYFQKNEFNCKAGKSEFHEKWHIDLDFNNVFKVISSDGTQIEFSVFNDIFNVLSLTKLKLNALSAFSLLLSRFPVSEDKELHWCDTIPLSLILRPLLKNIHLIFFPLFKIIKFSSENHYIQDQNKFEVHTNVYLKLFRKKYEIRKGYIMIDKQKGIQTIRMIRKNEILIEAERV